MRTQRQFVNKPTISKFIEGAKELLDENQLRKVRLLRLSIKINCKGERSVESVWGYVNRKSMVRFTINIDKNISEITDKDWQKYGRLTAEDFNNWAPTPQELDSLDRKYEVLQFNIWETTRDWDLAQDLINDIEDVFCSHLNGKLHWRVRKALTESIASLMERARLDYKISLSEKENIDLLKEIIQKSSITLKTSTPKSKEKTMENV